MTLAFVELALELDPVQSEGVEESREALHQAEHGHGQNGPKGKDDPKDDSAVPEIENV